MIKIGDISSDNRLMLVFCPTEKADDGLDEEEDKKIIKEATLCFSVESFEELIDNTEEFLNRLKHLQKHYTDLKFNSLDIIDVDLD